MMFFCFGFWFLLAFFVSPGNSHYCYQGIIECIVSCIHFCENINIEKKIIPNFEVSFTVYQRKSFHK